MGGFPTRISRTAIGPTLQNKFGVRDPTKEIPASAFNLSFWQLAGCNLMVPLAWAEIVVDALDASTLGEHAESWATDGAGAAPVVAHPGVGQFTITYAANYVDNDGVSVATNLRWAKPAVQSTTWWRSQGVATAANVIAVRVWDSAGAPDDPTSSSIFVPIW